MSSSLQHFDRSSVPAAVAEAIRQDGAAIIDKAIDDELVDQILTEAEPHLEATATGKDKFSGRNTRRTGSLLTRMPSTHLLAMHSQVLGVCDEILKANSTTYQLHLSQIIDIGAGEPAQQLHRDQWAWDMFPFPVGHEVEISTIWALHDFTEVNGATRVIPGSHLWEGRKPSPDDTIGADMARGSVLIYTGSVFHGGGANNSDSNRTAVNIDYCAGWLRQEENQYLSCPPDVARGFPLELARLIGYRRAAFALGYYGDTQDPIEALHPHMNENRGLGT